MMYKSHEVQLIIPMYMFYVSPMLNTSTCVYVWLSSMDNY